MTELTGQHHDLTAVVALVRDEIGENMRHVERQIAPHVRFGRWDAASSSESELEERFDPPAAPAKRDKQLATRRLTAVDVGGNGNPVFRAECLEPHAADVVEMDGDHADRAAGLAGNRGPPDLRRQVLYEVRR